MGIMGAGVDDGLGKVVQHKAVAVFRFGIGS